MLSLNPSLVEAEIVKSLEEIKKALKIEAIIDKDCCPGDIIKSPILITAMVRIGRMLGVTIPNNCYIFHDKTNHKQLSVKDAAKKLIKLAKNGN